MRIHCFQHVSFENPGNIVAWAGINHHTISYTYFFTKDYSLPLLGDLDILLVMGGPMNVYEEEKYPWLREEKQFIKQAIESSKKVIGICLGSQLIAAALGARVYACTQKEIGFFPIRFTQAALEHPLFIHFKNPYAVFHWHGDSFDLPENARLIASTSVCNNQAFLIHDQVLGLQFHFEVNENLLEDMLLHEGPELREKGEYIHSAVAIKKQYHYLEENKKDLFILLDKFLK